MSGLKIMRWIKYLIGVGALICILIIAINLIVIKTSQKYIYKSVDESPTCYTGLVLGALVNHSGDPSDFLQDRLDVAIELYKAKKIKKILLSGDHGQHDYDEVNTMKNYILNHGIDTQDVFLDHAGFDTYNSMVRAKEIFQVDDVIVITQKFHLSRAIYLARHEGLKAYGVIADRREYSSMDYLKTRELLANIKAFSELLTHKSPIFLGDKIPITGDSKLSHD